MNKLLIKFPTRGRSEKFLKVFEERYVSLATTNPYFLVTIDHDDPHADRVRKGLYEIKKNRTGPLEIGVHSGPNKSKIQACNSGMHLIPANWDVVLLASDDMIPMANGYDQIILDDMKKFYPDGDGCLWYNDGRCTDLNTLSILGRKYYERFGYIYHPEFFSLWADNFHQYVAQSLNKMTHIERTIIAHVWQDYTGKDALHMVNSTDDVFYRDKATFERLQKLPIESFFRKDSK